ncbi:DUF669 domain-containing protein [Arsenophonus nasoniae]|uniref:DUF669 domain-containing protein n=1 Tax=Arsenophonus nasoniae TaxID=638 RepID=A0A4P7L1W0_9GAMM|nr:DUF669 domain-containing protein [Arsenophonus nasoniae]QBY44024.1 hypothetical protein ArsFIN_25980 [Arsenophonus nasoniae]WGM04339.1 DUF669 domain-containing protein [Arsenophonus nasoniae]WGM09442.1 DUF669 domain-containing protein [Arsenophonus nasoniae]WGM14165.1 DUF669 domain-containing protein [Arsenophonus nasoniae]
MNHNIIFTYSEESALLTYQGGFINESGAYVITITEAKLTKSDKGSEFIEFSGESEDGRKVNYLSICCKKNDGTVNPFGQNMVNAIMGCIGIRQVTSVQHNNNLIAPEFHDKKVGLVLQKVLRTKKNGDESYSFDIRMPFAANTGQTLLEKVENKPAQAIKNLLRSLKDKDERKPTNTFANTPQPDTDFSAF